MNPITVIRTLACGNYAHIELKQYKNIQEVLMNLNFVIICFGDYSSPFYSTTSNTDPLHKVTLLTVINHWLVFYYSGILGGLCLCLSLKTNYPQLIFDFRGSTSHEDH